MKQCLKCLYYDPLATIDETEVKGEEPTHYCPEWDEENDGAIPADIWFRDKNCKFYTNKKDFLNPKF